MSNNNTTPIFISALKSTLLGIGKLLMITFAWCLRLSGIVLTKAGETIEKIIIKKN